jgi:hypothetical protein
MIARAIVKAAAIAEGLAETNTKLRVAPPDVTVSATAEALSLRLDKVKALLTASATATADGDELLRARVR